ncbi:hypothetical protein [Cellulomonas marina]|uniref:ATP/GTP-binding protein n=1 Tax=Cellulomonas marina TaxID=988821 RepID=A0A1I1AUP7_9CELL|nr:hypothetical protein [Cellulomonas marina]SFB41262.1 hypothetical protein SAMN05421867_12242 [Cellulomonas marina]
MPSSRRSRKRPWTEPVPELDVLRATGGRTVEDAGDGSWVVQRVRGSDRSYRCPGCDQLVPPGTPHVVAWSAEGLFGADRAVEDRRHWHSACWSARGRRGPSRRR